MDGNMMTKKVTDIATNLFINNGFDIKDIEYVDLIEDMGMDSITFMAFLVEIEECFNIVVPEELLLMENFNRINKIVEIIKQLYKENCHVELEEGFLNE